MRPHYVIALAFGLIALPLVATAAPKSTAAGVSTIIECQNNRAGS